MSQDQVRVPTFDQLMNPTIRAIRDLGGSGSIDEIYEYEVESTRDSQLLARHSYSMLLTY